MQAPVFQAIFAAVSVKDSKICCKLGEQFFKWCVLLKLETEKNSQVLVNMRSSAATFNQLVLSNNPVSVVASVLNHKPTGVGDAGLIPGSVKFLTSRHRLATGAALHCGLCLGAVTRQWAPPTRDTRKCIKRV